MQHRRDDLIGRLKQLSPLQHRVLEHRLQTEHGDPPDTSPTSSAPQTGRTTLAAFLVPRADGSPLSAEQLRHYLAERLPDYMIPSSFVFLGQLPQNANGKVDRQELKKLEAPVAAAPEPVETPCGEAERILIETWRDVLGQDSIGIHENFFELGGDSLLSIRILANARQRGLEITPEDFIRCQTIAEQARVATWTHSSEPRADGSMAPAQPEIGDTVDEAFRLVELDEDEMDRVSRLVDEADQTDGPV